MGNQEPKRRLRAAALVLIGMAVFAMVPGGEFASARSNVRATPTPPPQAAVINVSVISAERAAETLRTLFPHARIRVDAHANAIVVVASPDDVQQMRTVIQGIDVRNPQVPTIEVMQLRVLKPPSIILRLRALYPNAHIEAASKTTLLVRAVPQDMTEIKSLIFTLDVAPPTTAPTMEPADAVHVTQTNPQKLARALVREIPNLRASVSGASIILVGSQDAIEKAKSLAQQIDAPAFGSKYTQVYRLHNVDAVSVADLVQRSYPNVKVTVDKDLNAISILGTVSEQQRIGAAIAQLDAAETNGQSGGGGAAYGNGNIDVVQLQDAMPGQNGSPSTSAQDIATAVQQALNGMAPDLHMTVPANSSEIIRK